MVVDFKSAEVSPVVEEIVQPLLDGINGRAGLLETAPSGRAER